MGSRVWGRGCGRGCGYGRGYGRGRRVGSARGFDKQTEPAGSADYGARPAPAQAQTRRQPGANPTHSGRPVDLAPAATVLAGRLRRAIHPPLLWTSLCISRRQQPKDDGFSGFGLDCLFFEQANFQLNQLLAPMSQFRDGALWPPSRTPERCGFPFRALVNACFTGSAAWP